VCERHMEHCSRGGSYYSVVAGLFASLGGCTSSLEQNIAERPKPTQTNGSCFSLFFIALAAGLGGGDGKMNCFHV